MIGPFRRNALVWGTSVHTGHSYILGRLAMTNVTEQKSAPRRQIRPYTRLPRNSAPASSLPVSEDKVKN